MNNMPKEKIAIVAVSRDCFPMTLSENRRKAVVKAYQDKYGEIFKIHNFLVKEMENTNPL